MRSPVTLDPLAVLLEPTLTRGVALAYSLVDGWEHETESNP